MTPDCVVRTKQVRFGESTFPVVDSSSDQNGDVEDGSSEDCYFTESSISDLDQLTEPLPAPKSTEQGRTGDPEDCAGDDISVAELSDIERDTVTYVPLYPSTFGVIPSENTESNVYNDARDE